MIHRKCTYRLKTDNICSSMSVSYPGALIIYTSLFYSAEHSQMSIYQFVVKRDPLNFAIVIFQFFKSPNILNTHWCATVRIIF